MLYEIMLHIKNFFTTGEGEEGDYAISGGTISLPFLVSGQYFVIEGSVLNDGCYQYPVTDLIDEAFHGWVIPQRIPQDFLGLVTEIEAYQADAKPSEFQSESFGGYSYSKPSAGSGWQTAFRERLNVWRKR